MICFALLLFAIFSPSQSADGTQADLKARVAEQVEQIKVISGQSQSGWGDLPGTFPPYDSSAVSQLIKYGMDAIPELVPYLADRSLTQAYRIYSHREKQRVRVNDYIILVIRRITEHNFYLPAEQSESARLAGALVDPALPKNTEQLQDQVIAWWNKNRNRTLVDRKIDDINDPIHDNRFAAYEWLGRAKAEAARLPLEQRIETLLTGEVNTLKQSEMAACAESLGKIGITQSADAVRKVCDHLSYWIRRYFRPVEEGPTGLNSMQLADLFKAHHGLSDLGFKDEALSRLEELNSKYYWQMDHNTQVEFHRDLEDARNW